MFIIVGCADFKTISKIGWMYVAKKTNRFVQNSTEKNWQDGCYGSKSRLVHTYVK